MTRAEMLRDNWSKVQRKTGETREVIEDYLFVVGLYLAYDPHLYECGIIMAAPLTVIAMVLVQMLYIQDTLGKGTRRRVGTVLPKPFWTALGTTVTIAVSDVTEIATPKSATTRPRGNSGRIHPLKDDGNVGRHQGGRRRKTGPTSSSRPP